MIKAKNIGFLGGGKMAQAIAKGFINSGIAKAESLIASVHPSDIQSLESFKQLGAKAVTENIPVVEKSNIVFITVKPNIVSEVLDEVKSKSDNKLFISLAMGITLKTLEKHLSVNSRVIRAMSNIPALIQKGCSVFVRGKTATEQDVEITQKLFETIGTCDEISENFIDIVTALSGSGPAYIFVMIESLADGAVKMGLPRQLAYKLASQTVLGAGQLVRDTRIHPGQLKDDVTSPAGSTASGLKYLELKGFRSTVAGAIEEATKKCQEISGR